MCLYCYVADHFARFDPPWEDFQKESPFIPAPLVVADPWTLERLKEFEELLKRVKELEDKLGCPCEPSKADYLSILKDRIAVLERQAEIADAVKTE